MRCDLTDEEDAALARLLSDTINDDRYLLFARSRAFEEDPRQDPAGAVTCTTAAADPPQGNPLEVLFFEAFTSSVEPRKQ
jgi:hypothetical protein